MCIYSITLVLKYLTDIIITVLYNIVKKDNTYICHKQTNNQKQQHANCNNLNTKD